MVLALEMKVIFADDYGYNVGGSYNKMLKYLQEIFKALFISSCNTIDPDWLYSYWTDEKLPIISDEMQRHCEAFIKSKPLHSIDIHVKAVPDKFYDDLSYLAGLMSMTKPYLTFEDIKDDYETAKIMNVCYKADDCDGCQYADICNFYKEKCKDDEEFTIGKSKLKLPIHPKKLCDLTFKDMMELRKLFLENA